MTDHAKRAEELRAMVAVATELADLHEVLAVAMTAMNALLDDVNNGRAAVRLEVANAMDSAVAMLEGRK